MSRSRSRLAAAVVAISAAMFATTVVPSSASAAPTVSRPAASTSGHGLCLDLGSPEVKRALRVIGPPFGSPASKWVPRKGPRSRSLDRTSSCPPLMWAVFDTERGTVSSPAAVLLFRPGKFLGLTNRPTGYTDVSDFSPVSVTVTYRWPRRGDANADPSGGPVSSTFVPVFDRIYRIGALPPGL